MQFFRHSASMWMCTNHFTSQTFMAVTILLMKFQVCWVIMSCWLVYSYHSCKGADLLLVDSDDWVSMPLQNGCIYLCITFCHFPGDLNLMPLLFMPHYMSWCLVQNCWCFKYGHYCSRMSQEHSSCGNIRIPSEEPSLCLMHMSLFPWIIHSFISIQPWRPGLAGTRAQSCDHRSYCIVNELQCIFIIFRLI